MAPIDWSKTKIYKIVCNDLSITECYVGSTTNMTRRKCGHKYSCLTESNKGHHLKIYDCIRANGGWDNWSMILVEAFEECTGGDMARQRERRWYEHYDAQLNLRSPFETLEEKKNVGIASRAKYYESNRDKELERHAEYRAEHKGAIAAYHIEYYKDNKPSILAKGQEYRKANKAKAAERAAKYYAANRERILEQQRLYNLSAKPRSRRARPRSPVHAS